MASPSQKALFPPFPSRLRIAVTLNPFTIPYSLASDTCNTRKSQHPIIPPHNLNHTIQATSVISRSQVDQIPTLLLLLRLAKAGRVWIRLLLLAKTASAIPVHTGRTGVGRQEPVRLRGEGTPEPRRVWNPRELLVKERVRSRALGSE